MTPIARLRARVAASADAAPAVLGGDDALDPPTAPMIEAAVLIAVVDRAEPTVLLTRRAATLRRHADQVAFPGGRIDPEDSGPIAAALREAWEEVRLPPARVEVLGLGDPYRTGTGYRVRPVIGIIPPDLPLVPFEAEVAALFEVPLAFLLDPVNHIAREAEWKGRMRRIVLIQWETHAIWGATAGIIVNLAARLR